MILKACLAHISCKLRYALYNDTFLPKATILHQLSVNVYIQPHSSIAVIPSTVSTGNLNSQQHAIRSHDRSTPIIYKVKNYIQLTYYQYKRLLREATVLKISVCDELNMSSIILLEKDCSKSTIISLQQGKGILPIDCTFSLKKKESFSLIKAMLNYLLSITLICTITNAFTKQHNCPRSDTQFGINFLFVV